MHLYHSTLARQSISKVIKIGFGKVLYGILFMLSALQINGQSLPLNFPSNKPKVNQAQKTAKESAKPFVTLRIRSDLEGKIFIGGKDSKAISPDAPLDIPIFGDNCNVLFVGENGFSHQEKLAFSPDLAGKTQEKVLLLSNLYRIFLLKNQQEVSVREILNGIYQNMVSIPLEGAEIEAFEISRFEVTVGQYATYAQTLPSELPDSSLILTVPEGKAVFRHGIDWRHDAIGRPRLTSDYDHPVANVNWYEAQEFCKWLSKQDEIYQYRLPSALEWEIAASCGYNYIYPWGYELSGSGDSIPANTRDLALLYALPKLRDRHTVQVNDGYPFTSPVGLFGRNDFDMADMAGNVGEWVSDDRQRILGNKTVWEKQVKGGSFFSVPEYARINATYSEDPSTRSCRIGFRVVRTPK
jgi:sulfatase modifying factor 1